MKKITTHYMSCSNANWLTMSPDTFPVDLPVNSEILGVRHISGDTFGIVYKHDPEETNQEMVTFNIVGVYASIPDEWSFVGMCVAENNETKLVFRS